MNLVIIPFSVALTRFFFFFQNHIIEKKFQDSWSSYVLATVGIGNTAGRIILGYISDNPAVNRLFIYNTCLTICGFGKKTVHTNPTTFFLCCGPEEKGGGGIENFFLFTNGREKKHGKQKQLPEENKMGV